MANHAIPANCDPWRRLAAAVLLNAARDAKRGDAEARHWLMFDETARFLADVVGLDRRRVVRVMMQGER